MARPKAERWDPRKLQGFKYFEQLDGLLERLRPVGTERDRADNRQFFFDQYAALLVLYFFNPTVTTLRGIQQFTTLEKVQRLCGVRPTALGSLSEAAHVFDPAALEPVIAELAQQGTLWVATGQLPRSPGHVLYVKLNDLLAEAGFDAWVENLCRPYYVDKRGQPGIPPGVYFRMLLVGYFEGMAACQEFCVRQELLKCALVS